MTRFGFVMVAYVVSMATVVTAFISPSPRLIWNASASVPIGLYAVRPAHAAKVGDLVAVAPSASLAVYLAKRHYLPRGVPLLKHVAAVAGQRLCRIGTHIAVDGKHIGDARRRDRIGRALPEWQGCRRLTSGQIFLMNVAVADSFDGRYFGPVSATAIIGQLSPLWVDRGAVDDAGMARRMKGSGHPISRPERLK
jgi:conjugative transfer signal peptidase TraF